MRLNAQAMLGGGDARSQRYDVEEFRDDGMIDWKTLGVSIFPAGKSLTERDLRKIGH